MTDTGKVQVITAVIIAVALLISAGMITIAVAVSVNHAADRLEPEPETELSYSKEFIKTLDSRAGTIYTDGGGSVVFTMSDNITQSKGMLIVYKAGSSTTHYIPIDQISRIQV